MRINVIKAYLKKEFIDLFRSKMIVMVYLMPLMIVFLFGYGIKMEVTHSRTIILDNDNSKLSLKMINAFEHSKYFDTKVLAISDNEALKLIKKGKADIIIDIPKGFEKRALKHQKSEIGIFIDGAFPVRATTMQGYVIDTLLNKTSLNKNMITINQRTLFNQSMKDSWAIVPGMIGLALLVAPAILSALLIVKEKEIGTIFNFYSSPIKKSEFLIAKLTPPFLLHSVNTILLLLIALYVFELPFRGSFLLYFLATEFYIIISIGIGLLVSLLTSSQVTALVITILITIIPGFLYSGVLMPISSMDKASLIEAHTLPVMYYNHIIYDTFLIGSGFGSLINVEYLGILFVYGVFLILIGSLLLKKRLK
jgi:ABC-2 type transport system permease protein